MTDPVDTLTPSQMAAWIRETAQNTRRHAEAPTLTAAEMRLAPHVAFRLEQAAADLEHLDGYTKQMNEILKENERLKGLLANADAAIRELTKPDEPGAECSLCAAGMNSFIDPDCGKRIHARNGVVTLCTAVNRGR